MSASSRACRSFSQSRGFSIKDRKSTRLNSSHGYISYAVFCLKKKNNITTPISTATTCKMILSNLHPSSIFTAITSLPDHQHQTSDTYKVQTPVSSDRVTYRKV